MKEMNVNMDNRNELVNQMMSFQNEQVKVEYDGKSFQGKVEDVYVPGEKDWKKGVLPGFIIHNEKLEYKHIKIHRVTKIESDSCILLA